MTRKIGKWTAELLLVFIGAYAAFWLNSYQERHRDAQRRDVLLASLEEDVRGSCSSDAPAVSPAIYLERPPINFLGFQYRCATQGAASPKENLCILLDS